MVRANCGDAIVPGDHFDHRGLPPTAVLRYRAGHRRKFHVKIDQAVLIYTAIGCARRRMPSARSHLGPAPRSLSNTLPCLPRGAFTRLSGVGLSVGRFQRPPPSWYYPLEGREPLGRGELVDHGWSQADLRNGQGGDRDGQTD
jgi:hypothetical protein